MSQSSELVLLGKITAPHGVRGQLRVFLFSGEFSSISAVSSVILRAPGCGPEVYEVVAAKHHGKKFLIALKGIDSADKAFSLVGRELYVKPGQLPELPDGEFYWRDLIGLRVVTDRGEELGVLTEIIATGSNDVYVVKGDDREYLIPALADVVLEVDMVNKSMVVSPYEGLFAL